MRNKNISSCSSKFCNWLESFALH